MVGSRDEVEKRLEEELERLQRMLNVGYDFILNWIPDNESKLSGEIRGNVISIYEENEGRAVETLRHEILDYLVSQPIEPYRDVTNLLIKMINEDAYKRKEKVVAALTRLLETTPKG